MKKLMTAIITATLLMTSTAYADELDDAYSANEKGDYTNAITLFKPLALQGVAQAQHNLGAMYNKGRGVTQDYVEAIKWYKLAAAQSVAQSQASLASMYDEGRGVTQNHVEAIKWYKLAAAQGDAVVQAMLGVKYYYRRDFINGYMWSNLAAAQGDATAIEVRDIVASEMSQQQLAIAQKLSRECLARKYKGC